MAILVSDSFNRTGAALGNADTGQTWIDIIAGIGTNGTQAYTTTNADKISVLDVGIYNVAIQFTHVVYELYSKLIWRYVDSNNYFWIEAGSIYRKLNGTSTKIGSFTVPSNGIILRIEHNEDILKVYRNGTLTNTITDANHKTGVKHGIGMYSTIARIDDYSLETLGTTPTGTDGAATFDLKQFLYRDAATLMDSKQVIYQDSATGYDTRLSLYQDGASLFDMLQYISDSFSGSFQVDVRIMLYSEGKTDADTVQRYYRDGVYDNDLLQEIVEKVSIWKDERKITIKAWADSPFFLTNWKEEIIPLISFKDVN